MNAITDPVIADPVLSPRGFVFADQHTVAHALAAGLKRHGVEFLFGQSLPSMLHLACEQQGLQQLSYRTENAGGYMADAYARISGKPGVVTAQNGPAATLLVAPLAEALKASVPIIALVQEVARNQADRNAFQEFDHHGLFQSCAKWVKTLRTADRLEDYLDQAFMAACSGRPGPAVLLLPADLLAEAAPPARRSQSLGHFPLDRPTADATQIEAAAALLSQAQRPIVIAGGGVMGSRAWDALARLQETAHLPVGTTVMGKGGVDEGHPLSIGVIANFLAPGAYARHNAHLLKEADVVLLVGTRTNQNGTDSWTLYPKNARYIHIDVDGQEIGRNYEALRLVGDARSTLEALTAELAKQDLGPRQAGRAALAAGIAQSRQAYEAEFARLRASNGGPIRPEGAMHELQKHLRPEDIVVADASYSSIWITNYLRTLKPGMRFLTPRGLAGLGWGYPMGMGAKVASPTAHVYAVVGDGGFGHVWSELETAARTGTHLTLLVLNNGILGFQKHGETLKFGKPTNAVDFAEVDHAAIARACGCHGVRVRTDEELAQALAEAAQSTGTSLIEVMCDERAYPPISVFQPGTV